MDSQDNGEGPSTQPNVQPPGPHPPLQSFTLFRYLPAELRVAIWELALQVHPPRVLEIYWPETWPSHYYRTAGTSAAFGESCVCALIARARFPRLPAVAAVNHEARAVALALGVTLLRGPAAPAPLPLLVLPGSTCTCHVYARNGWFDRETDILMLPRFAAGCPPGSLDPGTNGSGPAAAAGPGTGLESGTNGSSPAAAAAAAAGPSIISIDSCPLRRLIAQTTTLAVYGSALRAPIGGGICDVLAELYRLSPQARPRRIIWVCNQLTLHGGSASFPSAFASFGEAAGTEGDSGSRLVSLEDYDEISQFVRRYLVRPDGGSPRYQPASLAYDMVENFSWGSDLLRGHVEFMWERLRLEWLEGVLVALSSGPGSGPKLVIRNEVVPEDAVLWHQSEPGAQVDIQWYLPNHPWVLAKLAQMPDFEMMALFRVCPLSNCSMRGWVV